MKLFLKRVFYFVFLSSAVIVIFLIFLNFQRYQRPIQFVTNSVSFDAKARFLERNKKLLNNAKVVVLGSSMSLNNIDCGLIEESLGKSIINIASWGLRIPDYGPFRKLFINKIVLINIQFSDFGDSWIEKYYGYPITESELLETINIGLNFATFKSQLEEAKEYKNDTEHVTYKSLNFDRYGGLLFSNNGFKIEDGRWNTDVYVAEKVDLNKIKRFVSDVENVFKDCSVIMSFSPSREKFYSTKRYNEVEFLKRELGRKCHNITFINNYDYKMPDSNFVDYCHFNQRGAKLYTSALIDSIKKKAFNASAF